MPTLEVPREKVQPKVTSGVQLPRGAIGAEGRALQQLGRTISGVGGVLFNISEKIKFLNETNQINEAILASEQFLDSAASERLKDRDFENHRPQFDKNWTQFVAETLPKYKSKRVQEHLTNYFGRQKVVQGVRIEADAYLKAGRDERASQSFMMQQSIEAELAETDANEQEIIRADYKADQIRLQKAGHLAEWQVDERLKTRAMMMVQTVAQREPEITVEALKSKETLSAILTQEDIDLLNESDMIFLRRIAQKELSYAQDKINAKKIEAIAEIKARVASMAGRGDFAGAQKIINESIELIGVKDHGIISNNLMRTSEYFGETGINYNKITHKPSVRADLRKRILNKTLTDDALIWQKVGLNGISESDATFLSKMIPAGGTAKDFRNSDAAKTYKEHFDVSPIGTSKRRVRLYALETGYRWLEDTLKENPDWTLRQMREEAMRISNRVSIDALAGEITTRPEDLPGTPLTPEQVREGMKELDKIDLSEIRKRRLKRQGGQMKTITTQKEYDALPSGTRYQDTNGAIGIKR